MYIMNRINGMQSKTMLSRIWDGTSSGVGGSTNHQRRRRQAGKQPPSRQNSFTRDIGHAASETYLITSLSFTLLRYLGIGYRWMNRLFALACYAMLLLPGFLQVGYYYFFSSQVRRSIVYGDQPRNRLDLFLPTNNAEQVPVVVFVTGGAWIIGYKAWGSLLGRQLAERNIIVACIDYRIIIYKRFWRSTIQIITSVDMCLQKFSPGNY